MYTHRGSIDLSTCGPPRMGPVEGVGSEGSPPPAARGAHCGGSRRRARARRPHNVRDGTKWCYKCFVISMLQRMF
jgi:hypothetical protein